MTNSSNNTPGVLAEGTEASFDLKEGDGLVEHLGWKMGDSHDIFTFSVAIGNGLKNDSFNIGITDEVGLFKLLLFFEVFFWI